MDTAGHSNLRFHSASALICGGLAALLWDAGAPLLRALLLLGGAWAEERHRSKKYGTPPEALGFQLATLACVAAALAWFMYASVSGDVKDRRTDLETARHLDQYHEADIYAADLKSAEGRLVPRVAAYLLLGACGYAGFLLGIKHYRARRAAAGDFPPKNS
jgi:hypothetical protein